MSEQKRKTLKGLLEEAYEVRRRQGGDSVAVGARIEALEEATRTIEAEINSYFEAADKRLGELHRTPRKQTSPRVSAIAGRYVGMSNDALVRNMKDLDAAAAYKLASDIRTLAASALGQDEAS